jgi:hypothetical protein
MFKNIIVLAGLLMMFTAYISPHPIIIWDNDGTVTGSINPNDPTRVILPHVPEVMAASKLNIICSGIKTPESESQNWDPDWIIARFTMMMATLPISMVTFSPAIGGIECWVMIKRSDTTIEIRKAHEDPRYAHYIGQFKKPDIGMLVVIRDIVSELFSDNVDADTAIFIGDSIQDQQAAETFGIPFVDASVVHNGSYMPATLTKEHPQERQR